MELHHSCVLPSNAPALPTPDSRIPRSILQEHSCNRGHRYVDDSQWARSPPSPVERYPGGPFGNYAHLNGHKSEEQVDYESRKLLALLNRCPKYQKYRERQPANPKKDDKIWPDELERAFFRGLVRWPPMGRGKLMIDGQLRGRNELIADSIEKETGVPRNRKQVSSHIQVLRPMVNDFPQLLMHMSKPERKKKRLGSSYSGHRRPQASMSSRLPQYGTQSWAASGQPYPRGFETPDTISETLFAMKHFAMLVQAGKDRLPVHYVTHMTGDARQPDYHFAELATWHKQYPELNFHETQDWKDRQVLVCHASINIMEKQPPGAELAIPYDIDVRHDLSAFQPAECKTRFYDSAKEVYHETKQCEDASPTSRKLHFGSQFWVRRLSELRMDVLKARRMEDNTERRHLESHVQRSLQYMTAIQDIYGTNSETGEQRCFLTILWRFHQTRNAGEEGKVTWRAVNFAPNVHQTWPKNEFEESKPIFSNTTAPAPSSIYTSLPLDIPHQSYVHHLPPLDLDTLSNIPIDAMADFSHPNYAHTAPSMVTDYSQTHSLPALSHSQDTRVGHSQDYPDPNDIDFHSGHIHLHLEPAINFGSYENFDTQGGSSLNPIHNVHNVHNVLDSVSVSTQPPGPFGDLNLGGAMHATCYPSKPWEHFDLISRIEAGADKYGPDKYDTKYVEPKYEDNKYEDKTYEDK